MRAVEKNDLTEPINPEQPQALSQSPVGPVRPEPAKQKLSGVKPDEIPTVLVDKDCRKCFGRGFTGRYADGSVKPCVCALKELRRRHALAVAEATKAPGGAKRETPEAPAPVQQEKSDGQENRQAG